jgi:hypothetical protein
MSYPPGWGPEDKTTKPYHGKAIDHPDIEWELIGTPHFISEYGRTVTSWSWTVACLPTGRRLNGVLSGSFYYNTKKRALNTIEHAACSLLAQTSVTRRTQPCALCDKPSLLGSKTCGLPHAEALDKARQELAQL